MEELQEGIMKALRNILACFGVFAICMAVIHRNVIKAVAKGEPVPEAPAWHTWVKNRKSS